MPMTQHARLACLALGLFATAPAAQAQGADPRPRAPLEAPGARPGETRSEHLDRTDGVIRPPASGAEIRRIEPPPPGATPMPVIPPSAVGPGGVSQPPADGSRGIAPQQPGSRP